MLKFFLFVLALLAALMFLPLAAIVVPLLIVGGLIKLFVFLVMVPFRVLGWLLALGLALFILAFKIGLGFLIVVGGAGLFVAGAAGLIVAPLLLAGLGIWVILRLLRPAPAALTTPG